MSNNSPPERDVKDFEFIQLCKFRVTSPDQDIPTQRGKLLTCSSQYGLVAYVTKTGFSVVRTADLLAIDSVKGKDRSKAVVEDIPVLASVTVGHPVLCLDVSGDGVYLAAAVRDLGHLAILFYDVRSFADKGSNLAPFARSQVNASSAAVVSDLSWNPAVSSMLAVCTSDGNVELIDVTAVPKVIAALPAAAGATCFCWSPKGKQLLVGKKDGTLVQYDHVLAEKRVWPCPHVLSGPSKVVDVVWQSTYIFLAAYIPAQAQPSDQPVVILSMSNKENKTTHINFEDVCFGNGEDRLPQYFFHFVQKWDVILMASSNATETTIVGRNLDDKTSWEHWNLEDCSRAELPLTTQQSDSFPMGLAVDYSPSKDIIINEGKQLRPCPVMFLLSTDGLLVGYYLNYFHSEAAAATTPALPLTAAGARPGVPELTGTISTNAVRGAPQSTYTVATLPASQLLTATPTLPAATAAMHSSTPLASATSSFLKTPPQPSSQPLFGGFTSSSSAATVFPFAGLGSKQGTPTSGATNQKPQPNNQAPPTSVFGQSGPNLFSFGNQSTVTTQTTTATSAFSNVGSSFTFPSATSGQTKPLSQVQTSGIFGSGQSQTSTPSIFGGGQSQTSTPSIFGGGQSQSLAVTPTPSIFGSERQTLGVTSTPSIFGSGQSETLGVTLTPSIFGSGQSQTLGVTSAPSIFGGGQSQTSTPSIFGGGQSQTSTPSIFGSGQSQSLAVMSTPSIFGHTQTPPGANTTAKDEGSKLSPATSTPGTQPFGTLTSSQLRPLVQSAFTTSKSTSLSPGQTVQSVMSSSGTPGNGLVLTGTDRRASPAAQPDSNRSIEATVDSAFTLNIIEEIVDFEKELAELRARSRREVRTVGSREEMQSLRQDRERMINYAADINKATKEQLSEVLEQKDMCFNLLAMAEECQSRHKRDLDPHYHSLLLGRVLDPASADRLKTLQQMSQSVEQSVREVDRTLDGQWQEHLSQKKKEERFYTPAGETIYKSIRNNHIVISSQRKRMEKLEEQLKNLRLYNKLFGGEFSSVTALNEDETSPLKIAPQLETTLTSAVASGMTPEKVTKLREILSQRKVPRIKSAAPANLSLSRIVHLTPGRSPASAAAPTTPAELQQQTPQRPVQQRKHQLPHPVQTMPSHLNFQLGTPIGQMQTAQKLPEKTQPVVNQARPSPSIDGAQRPGYTAPTSLSGHAYFKQQQTHEVVTVGRPAGMGMVPVGRGVRPAMPTTPGTVLGGVVNQRGHATPTASLASPAAALTGPSPPYSTTLPPSTHQSHMYENITPTETEEDDDDYDDEDNGYEDEEDEEDEEETGFEGIGNQPIPASHLSQVFGQQMQKNLQGFPQFSTPARADGGGVTAALPAVGTPAAATTSASVFKLPQSTLADPDVAAVASLKSTAQTSAVTTGISTSSQISSSTAPPNRNLFGPQPTTGPVFGGPALFGDKPGGPALFEDKPGGPALFSDKSGGSQQPSGQQRSVFGSHATPSRTVAFTDLAEKSDSLGKEESASAAPRIGAETTSRSPTSSTSPPSTAPSSNTSDTFSFVQAAAGAESPFLGGHKSTTPGLFAGASTTTSPAAASVFGGRSPSEGARFSFGTTPSTSATAGFTFVTPTTLPSATTSTTSTQPPSSPAAATTPQSSSSDVAKSVGPDSSAAAATAAEDSPTKTSHWGVTSTQDTNHDAVTTTSAPLEAAATPSMFGTVSTTPAPSGDSAKTLVSSFSGDADVVVSTSSLFGGSPSKGTSVFGGTPSSATAASLFGTPSSTTTSATPLFSSASKSLFGGASSASVFGGETSTSVFGGEASTSVFGGTPAPLFGSSSAATTTAASSVFGTGTTSTSAFGATTSPSSVFGGGTTTTTSAAFSAAGSSVFGGAGANKSSSLFGSSANPSTPTFGFGSTTTPVFGAASTPAGSGTSVFGGSTSGGGLFGSSSTPAVSSTGLFGTGSTSSSAFSSGATSQPAPLFGQTTTTTGLAFGQTSTTGGGSSLFGQSSTFGQQPASSTSGSLFGGFGGLGGKPSEEKAKLNVFGSPQVFGSTSNQNTNLFGSGGTSSFGGTGSSTFFPSGAGSFSAESAGVATSGFGVTSGQQTSGGFGAAPTFGSAPSFGASSAFGNKVSGFGSSPSFGGSPTFGSTQAFSSPAGSSSTFGSSTGGGFSGFASAAAPTFGQLAQSSPTASAFGSGGGFGSPSPAQPSPFGGGFASSQAVFGSGSVFGQGTPSSSFSGGQTQGFGSSPSFGSNPAFSSYRG